MKKTVQYIALAALTLSLAACQQDNALQEINDPNAVKINATIGALQSRVTYENDGATSFSNGDGIKVQNTKRTSKNEATYTYNGTTWSIQEGSLVWNSGENTNQFKAWYPATASYDSFELPEDQRDASKLAAADWMTATTADMSKPSNCELGLTFAHKLAKVTVKISETFGSQFTSKPTLTDVKIYTHDGTKIITPMAGTNSYTAIVTPGQYNGSNNFMTFNAENAAFAVKPTTTLTSGLEAGKHYTFTLTVGKDKATIGSVSVADWGTSQEITGGVVEEVNYVWTSDIVASESVEGYGTEEFPYLIQSANDLQWMIEQVNSVPMLSAIDDDENSTPYYRLTHNLEIDSEAGATWIPIGTEESPFVGYFDGGGCTISGEMHAGSTNLIGFFGYNAGTISNLKNAAEVKDCRTLMPASIEYSAIGSIAGYSTGKIIHCENSGDVTAKNITTDTYTGGICGYQYGEREDVCAFILECKNSGAVTGVDGDDNATGGIVGQSSRGEGDGYDPVVCASENTGSVTNGQYLGGICGYTNETPMLACRNLGEVEQADGAYSGGIVGYAYTEYAGMGISGCYTTIGYVSGDTFKNIEYASYYLYEVDLNDPEFPEWLDYIIGPWNDPNRHDAANEMNYAIVQYNGWYSSYDGCVCNWHWEIGENNLPVLVAGAPLGRIGG